ncbi:MAG TPA: hypothetical protein VIO94_08725 [Phenylobacterium sp.]
MPPNEGPAPSKGKVERKKAEAAGPKASTSPQLVSVTVDLASGAVVQLERLEPGGARREVSAEERKQLASGRSTLEALLEQAFEAGIDCVLDGDEGSEPKPESQEDAQISRLLLRSLIEHSAARRLMTREVLGQAIVGSLMSQVSTPRAPAAPPPESTFPHH